MPKTHMVRVSTQTKDTLDNIALITERSRGEILHEAVRLFLRENPKVQNTIRLWTRIKRKDGDR
jgi:predicted transcriptional regulator